MLRQSVLRYIPRGSVQPIVYKQFAVPLSQKRFYADAPAKQVKGSFLGKKNKEVIPIYRFSIGEMKADYRAIL